MLIIIKKFDQHNLARPALGALGPVCLLVCCPSIPWPSWASSANQKHNFAFQHYELVDHLIFWSTIILWHSTSRAGGSQTLFCLKKFMIIRGFEHSPLPSTALLACRPAPLLVCYHSLLWPLRACSSDQNVGIWPAQFFLSIPILRTSLSYGPTIILWTWPSRVDGVTDIRELSGDSLNIVPHIQKQ